MVEHSVDHPCYSEDSTHNGTDPSQEMSEGTSGLRELHHHGREVIHEEDTCIPGEIEFDKSWVKV